MSYSIGDPHGPTQQDQHFESFDEAEETAIQSSIDDRVWCVWDDKDGSVECLVFQGVAYY